ncbi:BppU family phage baseplate upper protein [Bacillus mycoides]|uniref:BppU family phage baseplate upper protein n=1 Tax=Bacillus mycoides TaxID=1405 RepID=UPI002E1CD58B|nr:BppU family phage baseplate upper protein [Bacillus mycoides]
MIFKTYEINIDLIKDAYAPEIIRFSQNDLNSAKLLLNITKMAEELDLSQAKAVRMSFKKPDGTRVFQNDCQPINALKGKYQIVLKTQTLTSAGDVIAQVHIEEEDRTIDTQAFYFKVNKSLASDEAIESTNDFGIIQKVLEAGEKLEDVDIPALVESKETAETALAKSTENTNQIGILSENISKKTNERPGVIPAPVNFTWKNPPIMIKKDTFGRYNPVFNIEMVPVTGKTYYVDINTGDDAKDGLTPATAFKNLSTTLVKTDVKVIYIAPGVYDKSAGWGISETNFTTTSLIIKPMYKGDIIVGAHDARLTWAAEGTPNVFKATRNSVTNVYDSSILDEYGDHKELTKKASVSEVSTSPGSWFADATSVYVRLADDRIPDNKTVWVYMASSNGFVRGNKTMYFEGIKFYGGNEPFEVSSKSASDNLNVYFKDCQFKYGINNGFSNGLTVKGARNVYLQSCIASRNQRDGFNYHMYNNINPNVIEVDCISYNNGVGNAEDNNNGSTMHELGNIIRVNGIYFRNKGPNVVDVGGSQSWNIGCTAYKSLSASTSSEVNFQNQDGKTWLDGCVGYDSLVDISEAGTGKVYSRRTLVSNELRNTTEY